MSAEREKVRCLSCELVQWKDGVNCRRCRQPLPKPVVKIVERIVEKVVVRHDPQCLESLERACRLISTATDRLTQPYEEQQVPVVLGPPPSAEDFTTMAEMEHSMIRTAYERSDRKPLVAARLLGI